MTDYEPGTVADVTITHKTSATQPPKTYRAFWSAYDRAWFSAENGRLTNAENIWDISVRPLVVLDFHVSGANPQAIVDALRERHQQATLGGTIAASTGWSRVADQIEAQTKPPRIPEPGMGRRVTADLCTTTGGSIDFLRTERGDWVVVEDREGSRVGQIFNWSNILDPRLHV